jgi:hypothetical protein
LLRKKSKLEESAKKITGKLHPSGRRHKKKESTKRLATFMYLSSSLLLADLTYQTLPNFGVPKGIRTPVLTVKG